MYCGMKFHITGYLSDLKPEHTPLLCRWGCQLKPDPNKNLDPEIEKVEHVKNYIIIQ